MRLIGNLAAVLSVVVLAGCLAPIRPTACGEHDRDECQRIIDAAASVMAPGVERFEVGPTEIGHHVVVIGCYPDPETWALATVFAEAAELHAEAIEPDPVAESPCAP